MVGWVTQEVGWAAVELEAQAAAAQAVEETALEVRAAAAAAAKAAVGAASRCSRVTPAPRDAAPGLRGCVFDPRAGCASEGVCPPRREGATAMAAAAADTTARP